MNYEELISQFTPVQKAIKDAAAAAVRQQKALQKNEDLGNIPEMKKAMAALEDTVSALQAGLKEAEKLVSGFDTQEYFISGDFTRQLLESCEAKGVDVQGEKGVYQMFPYKIRVVADEEHAAEVWLDRKKVNSVRPSQIAETIRAGRAKLYSANFNVESFMEDLAEAYETARLRSDSKNTRDGTTIALAKIYKYLAPTARARKDYDAQAFAFDLARAYEKGPDAWVTKDGKRFDLGTSRNGSGYRVLSSTGVENYISTLRHIVNTEE